MKMQTGFKGIALEMEQDSIVDIIHTEFLDDEGKVNPKPGTNNCLRLHCIKGLTRFESFEPYAYKYLKVIVRTGGSFILTLV